MKFRTDLVVESDVFSGRTVSVPPSIEGVDIKEEMPEENIKVTRVKVEEGRGEEIIGKPAGNYITIETKGLPDGSEEVKKKTAKVLSNELKRLVKFDYYLKVLVTGLGNLRITPDALGPKTLDKVRITRHLFLIYDADGDDEMACVSGLVPGVSGSTGMETADVIKKAAELVNPDVVLVIDALAARDIGRLSTTVQINDTGIFPGGGIGNHRKELSQKTLGRRVVSIGVPTVIDARTLLLEMCEENEDLRTPVENHIQKSDSWDMVVTSTDIDQIVADFSEIIANGINMTLHPGIYS